MFFSSNDYPTVDCNALVPADPSGLAGRALLIHRLTVLSNLAGIIEPPAARRPSATLLASQRAAYVCVSTARKEVDCVIKPSKQLPTIYLYIISIHIYTCQLHFRVKYHRLLLFSSCELHCYGPRTNPRIIMKTYIFILPDLSIIIACCVPLYTA